MTLKEQWYLAWTLARLAMRDENGVSGATCRLPKQLQVVLFKLINANHDKLARRAPRHILRIISERKHREDWSRFNCRCTAVWVMPK